MMTSTGYTASLVGVLFDLRRTLQFLENVSTSDSTVAIGKAV
jgi:hypothetical protein